jgi:hypothetical protein
MLKQDMGSVFTAERGMEKRINGSSRQKMANRRGWKPPDFSFYWLIFRRERQKFD